MRNFSGGNRSERGKEFGKRGGRDSGRTSGSRGGRDFGGRPQMHHATCDSCGRDCEVPFKPTSGKPIFCSRCFDQNQNEEPKKYGRERSGRSSRNFAGRDSRNRSYEDRYSDEDKKTSQTELFKKEFGILNKKLDKIIELLTPVSNEENDDVVFKKETEKPKPTKKATVKKVPAKKSVKKK